MALVGKFVPQPNMFEFTDIDRPRFQKRLYQALKTAAFVPFGKRHGTIFGQDLLEVHIFPFSALILLRIT
jgi:hypothetical protein